MSRGRRATRGRPCSPDSPKSPITVAAAGDSTTAKTPQASNVIRLEIKREKGGGKWVLAATSAPPISSARSHTFQILARLMAHLLILQGVQQYGGNTGDRQH
jgi:hypothetical protein